MKQCVQCLSKKVLYTIQSSWLCDECRSKAVTQLSEWFVLADRMSLSLNDLHTLLVDVRVTPIK